MKHLRVAGVMAFAVLFIMLSSLLAATVAADSSGWVMDLFSQRGGQGQDAPSLPYLLDSNVILYAHITYNQDPVASIFVAFQVDTQSGPPLLLGTAPTNTTGYSSINFTITGDIVSVVPSDLKVFATASPTQQTFNDTMTIPIVAYIPPGPVGGVAFPISNWSLALSFWVGCVALAALTLCVVSQNREKKHPHTDKKTFSRT